jgi:hypothetical protein
LNQIPILKGKAVEEQPRIQDEFPSFPDYEGNWVPFYYEPIPTSGERMTIAVAAWDADGLTVSGTVPRLLFPYQLNEMIELMVYTIRWKLEANGIVGVSIPGISVGHIRSGLGNDRDDVLEQAIALTSSLAGRRRAEVPGGVADAGVVSRPAL